MFSNILMQLNFGDISETALPEFDSGDLWG